MPSFTLLSAIAILFAFVIPGHNFHLPRVPAYAQRGDEVEALFGAYSSRLAGYHENLDAAVSRRAPELLEHLETSDPAAAGYQVLPEITTGQRAKQSWLGAVAYSWPWTARLIDRELRAIDSMEIELARIGSLANKPARALFERLLQNYRERSVQHRNIAAHIAYNRFWQSAIAADRLAFDRETALQALVIERQQVSARLQRIRGTFARPAEPFLGRGASIRLMDIERDLTQRQTLLARRIDEAMTDLHTPAFARMEKAAGGWVFRIPLFTDIADRQFVEQVKQIIESTWRLTDTETAYAVSLDVSYLSPDLLYTGDRPKPGERLELSRHLAAFPEGGAILTTGGITTHVRNHAIVFGPHPLTARTIAHEFGHILGFRDRYVRGYKNLGRDGFQVMEIVSDPADIMAATTQGLVQPAHFSRLTEHYRKNSPALQPVNRQESPRTEQTLCVGAASKPVKDFPAQAPSAQSSEKCQSL